MKLAAHHIVTAKMLSVSPAVIRMLQYSHARKLQVDYASDIHLEKRGAKLPWFNGARHGDVLVLAGDIGYPNQPLYREFLSYASDNWNNVVVIAGNHEYKCVGNSRSWDAKREIDDMISDTCARWRNVHYLNCSSKNIGGVQILGATLWHTYPNTHKTCYTSATHYQHYVWLEKELRRVKTRVLVVTHHLPSYRLIDSRFAHYKSLHCWASNSEKLIRAPVEAWICGHSHSRKREIINGIGVYVNADHKASCPSLNLDTLEV